MTTARKSLISLQDTPYYHVIARCVRRAWLWGVDEYAGRDYSHRKDWVLERLQQLAAVFAIDTTVLPDEALQERYENLTHEFRCMQCQNNSIADSPVGLASDLRRDVKELLLAGKTDQEIRDYMVQRYGNVILFRPPFKASTAWVWIAPMLALAGGIFIGIRIVRRRAALVASDESQIESQIENDTDRPQ